MKRPKFILNWIRKPFNTSIRWVYSCLCLLLLSFIFLFWISMTYRFSVSIPCSVLNNGKVEVFNNFERDLIGLSVLIIIGPEGRHVSRAFVIDYSKPGVAEIKVSDLSLDPQKKYRLETSTQTIIEFLIK